MKKLKNILFIPLLLLFLTACSDKGIFYFLENETVEEDDNNLNNNAVFSNMVYVGGNYIGNAGPNIYYRSDAADISSWSSMIMPAGFETDATNTSMVLVGTDLFISRISHDGAGVISNVYRLDTAIAPIDVVSSSWELVVSETNTVLSFHVYRLHTADGNLYINDLTMTRADQYDDAVIGVSALYYIDDAAGVTPADFTTANYDDVSVTFGTGTEEILKILYDGAARYWMIYNDDSDGFIFYATDGDLTTGLVDVVDTATDDPAVLTEKLVDLFIYSTTEVLISNQDGSIYLTEDADQVTPAWEVMDGVVDSTAVTDDELSGHFFNGFADIDTLTADTANMVIVGTTAGSSSATGYYQIDMSAATKTWTDANFSEINNYVSIDLSSSSIKGFLYDDTVNKRLFAYTTFNGVYLNYYSTEDIDRIWSHE